MIFIIYLIGLVITYFTSGLLIRWRLKKTNAERKTDKEVKQVLFWMIIFWFISVPVLIVCFIGCAIIRFWQIIAGIE
jgi:hypothetical protein